MPQIKLADGRVVDVEPVEDAEGSFWHDKITDRYYPRKKINPTISAVFNPPGVSQKFDPSERIENTDDIIRNLLKFGRPVATGVASGMAGMLPLPLPLKAAAILGTGLATDIGMSQAQKAYGGYDPSISFGDRGGGVSDVVAGGIENVAGNELGARLFNAVARKFMPFTRPGPEALAPFKQYPEVPATFSQVAEGQGKILEDILGGKKRESIYKQAQTALGKTGARLVEEAGGETPTLSHVEDLDPRRLLNKFYTNAKSQLNNLMKQSEARFSTARNIATLNYRLTRDGKVEGPIYPRETIQFAKDFLDKNGYAGVDPAKIVNTAERDMVTVAQDIMRSAVVDKNGMITSVKPVSFDYALKLKQAAGELGYAPLPADQVITGQKQRTFRGVNSLIDKDIENSIANEWKNGSTDALKAYREGNAIISVRHQNLEQGDEISRFLKGEDQSITALDNVLSTEQSLNRALSIPGNRKALGAYMIQRAMQHAWTAPTKANPNIGFGFDSGKLKNFWNSPENITPIKKLFNADQKAKIDNFFTVLSSTSQAPGMSGKIAAAIRIGNSAVYVGSALATGSLFAGNTTPGLATAAAITGGYIALDQFVSRVMLNPKAAMAATKLLKEPATSPATIGAWKTVMGALQGAKAVLTTADGKEIPVEIGQ